MARVRGRKPTYNNNRVAGGPHEAIVVNHLDPSFMGGLEVELVKNTGVGNNPERTGQLYKVRYLSPFYGVTPMGAQIATDGYDWTQKSYGMWFVPPDIGTRVLVIFSEENPAYGYWIGCIPDRYMNFMVPDGRASTELTTPATPSELQGLKLPVGEYNKSIETGQGNDPTKYLKPYQKDFVQSLEIQGLLKDETRGTTTTSARREVPSQVFGISTPGPYDKRPGAPKVNYATEQFKTEMPGSRLGGSSFVMDDGDDKLVRSTHASEGPPEYRNREAGETGGDTTLPHNELIRLRTRTGHQILLHNSEDLIYIANSRGTAWIELTSDGKIDVFANDSISMRTTTDFNLTAERDINMEAGRNVNIKASARFSNGYNYDTNNKDSGRVHIESRYDTNLDCGADMRITTRPFGDYKGRIEISSAEQTLIETGREFSADSKPRWNASTDYRPGDVVVHEVGGSDKDFIALEAHVNQEPPNSTYWEETPGGERRGSFHLFSNAEVNITSLQDTNIKTFTVLNIESVSNTNHYVGEDYLLKVLGQTNTFSTGDWKVHSDARIDIDSGQSQYYTSASNINLKAASLLAGDAAQIHWNSGLAGTANVAGEAGQALDARHASTSTELSLITLPNVQPGTFDPFPYNTIVARAPQHEPWPHHENLNPLEYTPEKTDREKPGSLPNSVSVVTPDTFRKNTTTAATAGGSGVGVNASGRGTFTQPTDDPLAPSIDRTTSSSGQFSPPGEPIPVGDLVGTIDGFNQEQTAAYLGAIGQRESGNRYDVVNSIGFAGKYQFGSAALKEAGMLKPEASNRNSSMDNPANWTGQYGVNSKQDWLDNVNNCQEFAMITYTNKNRRYLVGNGGIRSGDTIEQQAGMLAGAHLLGAGGMRNWRRGSGGSDAYGTTGSEYYALGNAAVGGTVSEGNALADAGRLNSGSSTA